MPNKTKDLADYWPKAAQIKKYSTSTSEVVNGKKVKYYVISKDGVNNSAIPPNPKLLHDLKIKQSLSDSEIEAALKTAKVSVDNLKDAADFVKKQKSKKKKAESDGGADASETVTALGKYTVYNGWKGDGSDDKEVHGGNKEGWLEDNFSKQIGNMIAAAKADNVELTLQSEGRGLVWPSNAKKWGGDWWKDKALWCNGLMVQLDTGVAITKKLSDKELKKLQKKDKGAKREQDSDAVAWLKKNAEKYGIGYKTQKESNGKTRIVLFANNVTGSDKVEKDDEGHRKIEYDGPAIDDTTSADASSAGDAGAGTSGGASVNSTAYFFSNQFSVVQADASAIMLTGERALANDQQLWGSITDAVKASLRSFCSDGAGRFVAWYPDYFGKNWLKSPNIVLKTIELKNLTIRQSDSNFFSHVYTPGVDVNGNRYSTAVQYMDTSGCVSIESDVSATVSEASSKASKELTDEEAAATGDDGSNFSENVSALLQELVSIPADQEWKYSPKELYARYGARPCRDSFLGSLATVVDDFYRGKHRAAGGSSAPASTTSNDSSTDTDDDASSNSENQNTDSTNADAAAEERLNPEGSTSEAADEKKKKKKEKKKKKKADANQGNSDNATSRADANAEETAAADAEDGNQTAEDVESGGSPAYILPFLSALYTFMEKWSSMYNVSIDTTFNPEIFPGIRMRVDLDDKHVEVYVKSVSHSMRYSDGFNTSITCTCPRGNLVPGMLELAAEVEAKKSLSDAAKAIEAAEKAVAKMDKSKKATSKQKKAAGMDEYANAATLLGLSKKDVKGLDRTELAKKVNDRYEEMKKKVEAETVTE